MYGVSLDGLLVPKCGGIFKDMKDSKTKSTLITFFGTDPYSRTNVLHWDQSQSKWLIPSDTEYATQSNKKGTGKYGKLRPIGFKDHINTREACITYTGAAMYNSWHKDAWAYLKKTSMQVNVTLPSMLTILLNWSCLLPMLSWVQYFSRLSLLPSRKLWCTV